MTKHRNPLTFDPELDPNLESLPSDRGGATGHGQQAAAQTQAAEVAVSVVRGVDASQAEVLWRLYLESFEALRTRAANRQVMSRDEFMHEMLDQRVEKYVAHSAGGDPIGLSTLTADLESVWWVSPQYYAHRYPEHFARGAILYLGFALVHPHHRRGGALTALLTAMGQRASERRAVVGYDICSYNHDAMDFANAVEHIMSQRWPVATQKMDAQVFYTMDFGQV